jgi:hypothetical protein
MQPSISELTRRDIFDAMTVASYSWSGRLPESEFLSRLYPLKDMPSYDHRHADAGGDIARHREYNLDWSDDWVLTDPRFDLLHASDEDFLRFLCEMIHPVVQPDREKVDWALRTANSYLATDGWEIAPCGDISGRPIFAARRRIEGAGFAVSQAQRVADALSGSYVSQQITRMQNALEEDPELAIGTAKEFVETICKTILARSSVPLRGGEELLQLVRLTLKQLKLTPDDVTDDTRSAEIIRVLLASLGTITHKLAELRNLHGSGHGKDAAAATLGLRHARLAVGAASTFCIFIFETYQSSKSDSTNA